MCDNWVTMAKSIPKILFCFPENSLFFISFFFKPYHFAITQILSNGVLFFQAQMAVNVNKADCYIQTPRINQGK